MYAHLEIGEAIPAQLFESVAKVLAWAYEMREDMSSGKDLPEIGPLPELPETRVQRAMASRAA